MSSISAQPALAAPRPAGATGAAPAQGGPVVALDPLRLLQQYWYLLAAAAVGGTVFGTAMYFILLFTFPRYTAEVRFECKPPFQTGVGSVNSAQNQQVKEEPNIFMATQALVLKSDVVLGKAVMEPSFKNNTQWAKDFNSSGVYDNVEALKELRKVVSAYVIPETSIIQLQVRVPNRGDSAVMANAIKDVFLKDTEFQTNTEFRNLLELVSNQAKNLDSDIKSLDVAMQNLLSTSKLTGLEQQYTENFVKVERLQPTIVELRDSLAKATEQAASYEELAKNPSGVVYPDSIRKDAEESRVVEELKGQIASVSAHLRADRQEFGDEHQVVKRAERVLKSLEDEKARTIETKMAELFNAAREQLRNSKANMQASITELETRLEDANRALNDTALAIKQYKEYETTRSEKVKLKSQYEERATELQLMVQRGTRVRMVSEAHEPDTPSFPLPQIIIPLASILVIGITATVIVLREIREQRIRTPQDVALIPRTRAIGFVPELDMDPTSPPKAETAVVDRPEGALAESYRHLRNAVLKACQAKGHKTLLLASGLPGSGTSSAVSNLAASMGSLDMKVLVIDANVRKPNMHNTLGVPEPVGVAEALRGEGSPLNMIVETKVPGVSLLPAGKDRKGASERLSTAAVSSKVLAELKEKYDMILIDVAPAVVASDATALSSHADAVVLIVRAFHEKRGLVARLRSQLGDHKAEFLGVLVNAVQASAGGYFRKNFEHTMEYSKNGANPPASGDAGKPAKSA